MEAVTVMVSAGTVRAASLTLARLALLLGLGLPGQGAVWGSPVGPFVPATPMPPPSLERSDSGGNGSWTLSVIHLNDFHARFEPVSPEFTSCDPSLVGMGAQS